MPEMITRNAIAAGLAMRASGIVPADERLAEQADEIRSYSLVDICREACRLEGITPPHGTQDLIVRAFTTASLSNILTSTANASLMKGFNESPCTSLVWCDTTEEPDFKTARRSRLGSASDLEKVNDGGEIEHGKPDEWSETYQLDTYARMITLTRQDVLNDNTEALGKTPQRMGFAARRKIDDLLYIHFLANGNLNDNTALFHADHSNLITSAALASDTLSAAKAKMRKQTDLDGKTVLNIEPKYLIVPPELEHTALELVKSSLIVYGGDNESVRGNANIHQGSLTVVVEPRLSNSSYTGYSATTWYLAAAPSQADTLVVAFLKGQRRKPLIERADLPANVLGIGWRVIFDLAVKAMDFRGLVKNTA